MRLYLAIIFGKLISLITKSFHIGGGAAAPGLYALKIEPKLINKLASKIPKTIVVTGTNGKTTTARMINHILTSQGLKVIRNSTGSNLERGIASELIAKYHLLSTNYQADYAIWEVDEAAFNKIVPEIKPDLVIFLNAFRDQLDRYGEVDSVIKKWCKSLEGLNSSTQILINGDDYNLHQLKKHFNGTVETFGVEGEKILGESKKKSRIKLNFEAKGLKQNGLDNVSFQFLGNQFQLPVPGLYHVYNALAAITTVHKLNIPLDIVSTSVKNYSPAFGRFEKLENGYIFLIKNPTGTTEVIKTITPVLKNGDRLLLALNDNFADGLDVSWIWDTEFERLQGAGYRGQVWVSGTRAEELAVRLKYAGFKADSITILPDTRKAFKEATKGLNGQLYILPTYTALLELQAILAKSGAKQHYWKEQ